MYFRRWARRHKISYFEKGEDIMAVDNKKIAENILSTVGGKENVTSATHCMTRLRLTLKDMGIPKEEDIKNISGVAGVVQAGGQLQIVIGQNVPKVYREFCDLTGLAVQETIKENLDAPKEKLTPKKIASNIMGYLASCVTPLVPVMIAAGLFKAVQAVLGPSMLGILAAESHTYLLLDFLFNAGFYFMPILAGFNAAKKLKVTPALGAYMGCILLAPGFMQMVTDKTPFTIFGIPVTMTNYSQTLLPVVVSVAFLALVYRLLEKVMPTSLSTIFTPFFTMLITTPVALLALAPIGTIAGNLLGGGIVAFGNATGFLGVAVLGAIWELLVLTGMHMVVTMPFFLLFFEQGYQSGAILGASCATWACFGVALGAFLRMKKKEDKSMSLGFFISGIIGGVTEPTLYGLCLQHRRCFIPLMLGGFAGGAYMGIANVCQYVLAGSNFLSVIGFTGGTTANLVNGVIACILSMVVATVATYFIGFSKEELEA